MVGASGAQGLRLAWSIEWASRTRVKLCIQSSVLIVLYLPPLLLNHNFPLRRLCFAVCIQCIAHARKMPPQTIDLGSIPPVSDRLPIFQIHDENILRSCELSSVSMRSIGHRVQNQTSAKTVSKTSIRLANARRSRTSASTRPGRAVDSARSMGGARRLRSGGPNGTIPGLVSCDGASGGELATHEGNTAFSAMRSNCKA